MYYTILRFTNPIALFYLQALIINGSVYVCWYR